MQNFDQLLFVVPVLVGFMTGCGTLSRRHEMACDVVLETESPTGVIDLTPPQDTPLSNEVVDPTLKLVSIPLGNYHAAPRACRPSRKTSVAQVEWKSKTPFTTKQRTTNSTFANAKPISQFRPIQSREDAGFTTSQSVTTTTSDPDRCLPLLTELKKQTESKSAKLEEKLFTLEQTIQDNEREFKRMAESLKQSNTRIESLKYDVDKYRGDLAKLESSIERQHIEDLKILDSLSKQLGSLLDESASLVR